MHPFLYGVIITISYIIVAVGLMLLLRKCFTIPDELFRKALHFILLGAYIPLVFAFEAWWMAAIFAASLNYYHCTDEILSGLGQMYVADDRFQLKGTAEFICEAIAVYCHK